MSKRCICFRYIKKSGLFFLLFLYFAFLCRGQSYLVHRYSEADGLSGSSVFDLTQDQYGRIWFVTRAGVSFYDGVSWKNYTMPDELPKMSFFKIQADKKERIWLLSHASPCEIQVVYHDYEKDDDRDRRDDTRLPHWNTIAGPRIPNCKSLAVTSFQVTETPDQPFPFIAVGTRHKGLFLWDPERRKWKNIREKDGLVSNCIRGIAPLGNKLYAAADKGLSIINLDSTGNSVIDNRLNHSLDLPGKEIYGIGIEYKKKYRDGRLTNNRVWLSGPRWLGFFKENSNKMNAVYPIEFPLKGTTKETQLLPDYRCGVYAANTYGIRYFNYMRHSWEIMDVNSNLTGGRANRMLIDFEKNIWIASDRGVSKISSRRFANLQMKQGLLEDEVSALLEWEPGKFALGHYRGITLYDEKQHRFRELAFPRERLPRDLICRVMEIRKDSKKNLWLALAYAGVAKITPQLRIVWFDKINGERFFAACLWIDKKDNVWIGADKGIFILTHPGNKSAPRKIGNFFRFGFRRIEGFGGQIRYIASRLHGVLTYDERGGTWKEYRLPGGPKANNAFAVRKDSRGRLLIGTLTGLFILENQTPVKFKEKNFQVNRPVYFILEDNKNRLWLGTDNGVIRWDGKTQKTYSLAEGLIGLETNRAAAIVDSRGRLWFGTSQGVSIYDETFDDETFNPAPRVRLLDLHTTKKRISLRRNTGEPIRLKHNENTIVFHFRGLSFMDETAIRFKSKLDGFDNDWSAEEYPYKQMIRYTNLSAGRYRFHVKARNALGVWSDVKSSPLIIIRQPFHNTWWFFLLVFLSGAMILYGIIRFFLERRHAATLEKQVEERTDQLQTLEKQYRRLFEESKDVVFISTYDGKWVDMNPAGVEFFGFQSKEEALATPITSFYYNPEDRASFQKEIETKGYLKDFQVIYRRRDGEKITGLVTATAVRDNAGQTVSYRGIIRDITARKKLEQQLMQAQKMEAIGTLAGGIAHDFNNILGVILGYMEMMLEDLPPGSEMHRNAGQVMTAALRAADLVKQILAFSRQDKRERIPLELHKIIKEALKLLRSTLPANIEIRQNVRTQSDIVLADPIQMHQVIMNLGANAAHAMRESGGIFAVSLDDVYLEADGPVTGSNTLLAGQYLRLTVSDTGHGISPEVMKRIFEPYFTTKNAGEGTGMGLAVIHGIIKSHGGDITVYSETGKGTTFQVYLPQLQSKAEPLPRVSNEIPGGNERILVVDDESSLTEMMTRMLTRLGYKTEGKTDPREALQILTRDAEGFDLVISDISMPRITGLQLVKQVKQLRPGMPVILCTGFSTTVTDEKARALGVDDFVMKPIIKSELARVVRRVLDESQKGK